MKSLSHKTANTMVITTALSPVVAMDVIDHLGEAQNIFLVQEQSLTIYLNRMEIVTVMTMGAEPAYLVAGFLLNQRLVESSEDIESIHIDWEVGAAAVYAKTTKNIQNKTEKRVVTSGCGQGTMFADVMSGVSPVAPPAPLSKAQIYHLLGLLAQENDVYKKAGGVHSCALCTHDSVIKTIEDVGRHNAVDALAGFMALEQVNETPTIMYTTGRLTSEMVIKTVQMGLSIVISRSGATYMGVNIARQAGVTLVSRAKGSRFLILSGAENIGG